MADEATPKPDGILPGMAPRPFAAFPPDAVYSGAPAAPPAQAIAAGSPPLERALPAPMEEPPAKAKRAEPQSGEFVLILRSLVGILIILLGGWAILALGFYLDNKLAMQWSTPAILAVYGIISLVVFFLLEKDLWLSSFMGLRLTPYSTQMTEALFFTLLGPVGLLLRSSANERPVVAGKAPPHVDGTREIVETVVFVVVLVLLLKTFVVEAFVIPTGSMATTLLGYHKKMTCEKCGWHFLVNCSAEVEPQEGRRAQPVTQGYCPLCRFNNDVPQK